MFNDCITLLFIHLCLLFILKQKWPAAFATFALALSVKMNALLILPALLLVALHQVGLARTLALALIIPAWQILVAIPFLRTFPSQYLAYSFNFSRIFLISESRNWFFLGPELFYKLQTSNVLLIGHVVSLILWAHYRILRAEGGIITFTKSLLPQAAKKTTMAIKRDSWPPTQMARCILEANLIGIIFAKSMHLQFATWYCMTNPLILTSLKERKLPLPLAISLFLALELCWFSRYPTVWASLGTQVLNCVIVLLK